MTIDHTGAQRGVHGVQRTTTAVRRTVKTVRHAASKPRARGGGQRAGRGRSVGEDVVGVGRDDGGCNEFAAHRVPQRLLKRPPRPSAPLRTPFKTPPAPRPTVPIAF